MLKKEHYFPTFSLVVAMTTLAFVLYSGQQQKAIYSQAKELNAQMDEILKNKALLSAQAGLPSPISPELGNWEKFIQETHVRKTTCSSANGSCNTAWVPKAQATQNPTGGASCFDTTIRDPLKNGGKEYVVKTTCQTY
jgi:hypothetical protein